MTTDLTCTREQSPPGFRILQITAVLSFLILTAAVYGDEETDEGGKGDIWQTRVPNVTTTEYYRPEDGSEVSMNPPAVGWPEMKDKTTNIQIAKDKEFTKNLINVENYPWPAYVHNAPLDVGTWYWRMKTGENWGPTLSFIVPADAVIFPCPSPAEQKKLVPATHPRLYTRPESVAGLRQWCRSEEGAPKFAKVLRQADKFAAEMGPTVDPENEPNIIGEKAQLLGFAYLITGEKKYGDAGRNHLFEAIAQFASNKRASAQHLSINHISCAYDWLYSALSEEEIHKVRENMAVPMAQLWKRRGLDGAWEGRRYNPIALLVMADAAIAFYGEVDEAKKYLDSTVNEFYAAFPGWPNESSYRSDAPWYWGCFKSRWYRLLAAFEPALQVDVPKQLYYRRVLDYMMYVTPPSSPNLDCEWPLLPPKIYSNSEFTGESPKEQPTLPSPRGVSEIHSGRDGGIRSEFDTIGSGECYDYLLRKLNKDLPDTVNKPYWSWWAKAWDFNTDPPSAVFACISGSAGPLPQPKPPTNIPQSKLFPAKGLAALNTDLTDSAKNVQFLMSVNPRGRFPVNEVNDVCYNLNAYSLVAYGDALFPGWHFRDDGMLGCRKGNSADMGLNSLCVNNYPSFITLRDEKALNGWAKEACIKKWGHPPVMFPKKVIAEKQFEPDLNFVTDKLTPEVDYVAGEGSLPFKFDGGQLKRFRRNVVFIKPELIVIYDDLVAPEPSTFQWRNNSWVEFSMDEKNARLNVQMDHAGADVQYLAPMPVSLCKWRGLAIYGVHAQAMPGDDAMNTWHLEAGTQEKREQLGMLTVIVPYRVGQKREWTAERLETQTALGVKFQRDGKTTFVAFKKEGAAIGAINGQTFSEPFLVH